MKAILFDEYGSPEVLRLGEVDVPVPTGDQVLVKVRAVSVNAPDWRLMRANPFFARAYSGLLRPKFHTLGSDIAGTVGAVGPRVTEFRPGDEVFGDLSGAALAASRSTRVAPNGAWYESQPV